MISDNLKNRIESIINFEKEIQNKYNREENICFSFHICFSTYGIKNEDVYNYHYFNLMNLLNEFNDEFNE